MIFGRTLLAATMVAAIGLGASALALAHGPAGPSGNPYYGWQGGPMMGPGYGMGPGMMGPGYGMGPGMMSPGYGMGQGMMQPLRQDLTVADVKHIMGHRLAWSGNPDVKLGKVEQKDDDTIDAEIVNKDGAVVQKLEVNRHTGWMRRAQ